MPSLSTFTLTLKQLISDVPKLFAATTTAFTFLFSLSMICAANSPLIPSNSAHELLPSDDKLKENIRDDNYYRHKPSHKMQTFFLFVLSK